MHNIVGLNKVNVVQGIEDTTSLCNKLQLQPAVPEPSDSLLELPNQTPSVLGLTETEDRLAACGSVPDHHAQEMPDQQATLQQIDGNLKMHQPRYDCQGLELLTCERRLGWEQFVLPDIEGGRSSSEAESSFEEQAQLAEQYAHSLSGLTSVPDCLP